MIIPVLYEQTASMLNIVPAYYDSLRNFLLQSPNLILQQISWRLPPQLTLGTLQQTGAEVAPVTYGLDTLSLIIRSTFIAIATFMLSLYWTLDGQRAVQGLSMLMPLNWREQARELVREMESRVGAFVRGQALLCVTIGLLSLVAYLLIGLPYALVLALFAGLMELIPYLGPVLGALPAIVVGITLGPEKAFWVVVATLIIQQLENTFLLPRIMKGSVGVNSIVALLAIVTLGSLLGVIGALLAIPIAAIVQLLLDRFVLSPEILDEEQPVGRGRLGRLHYQVRDLLQDVRKQARYGDADFVETSKPVTEEVEAIAADLESILVQGAAPEVRL
jgi:predicted PurR-regulated permease PerM